MHGKVSSRDVIQKSMIWRIGNGQLVRIKENKWLPMKASSSIISPLPTILPETRVCSLIDADLRVWKAELIRELFLPSKASVIMGIPLSIRNTIDREVWAYSPSGVFTTSSAYNLLAASTTVTNARSSNLESQKRFWRAIWHLRVPNKIKHFVWKACNNALPTKM